MSWLIVERKIGKAGNLKQRQKRQSEWNRKYGENWMIGYVIDGEFVSQEDALESIYYESYTIFEMGGQVLGGKDFVFKGKKGNMIYEVFPNTKPVQFDFIISTSKPGKEHRLLCIAEFLTNDKMKFATNFGFDSRPTEFNKENSIILTREKK